LFLTGHPINQYEPEIKHFTHGAIVSLQAEVERARGNIAARVAGLVVDIRTRQTRQGKTMGFAVIDDRTGRLEIAAYSDVYDKYRAIFARDNLLIAEGSISIDDYLGGLRLTLEKLYSMEQAREMFARSIHLNWRASTASARDGALIAELSAVLKPFRGGACPVSLDYSSDQVKATLQMGDDWRVHPTDDLIARLRWLLGSQAVEIRYT
jgi:DNA polymerase-3 subunit alpha